MSEGSSIVRVLRKLRGLVLLGCLRWTWRKESNEVDGDVVLGWWQ